MVQGLHMYLGGAEASFFQNIPASKPNHSITPLCVETFPTSLPVLPSSIPVVEGGKLLTKFRRAQGVLDSEPCLPQKEDEEGALPLPLSLDCFVGH